jgi:hypothetical protein
MLTQLKKIRRKRFNFMKLSINDQLMFTNKIVDVRAGRFHTIGLLDYHYNSSFNVYAYFISSVEHVAGIQWSHSVNMTWYIYHYQNIMMYVLNNEDLILYKLLTEEK